MKKLSSYFFAVVFTAIFFSCGNDGSEGGVSDACSLEGNWKVKTAEVTCDKADKTILQLAKESMLKYNYVFTADSVTVKTNGKVGDYVGTYKLDASTNSLTMNTLNYSTGRLFNYNMEVLGCNGEIITVSNSSPMDTAGAVIMKSTMVLERVK